jgi:acyl-CoA synthetase (AMP-forming)/AMP-acid ligase II/acyl carrier protein
MNDFELPVLDISHYSSLVALLRFRALQSPEQTGFIFVSDDGESRQTLSYGELDRLARCVAARIQTDYVPGERALLLYPDGLDFITGFFGCLYAGVVAVPATAPRTKRNAKKLQILTEDVDPRLVLSIASQKPAIERRMSEFGWAGSLAVVATDLVIDGEDLWREYSPEADALAFLQYTSGSSGTPKGVMVSHRNILHNQEVISAAFGETRESVGVSWLPLFHDMGLIGAVLQPLFVGFPGVQLSPSAFIQNPLLWLQLISQYGGTTGGGPNFAYDHCVDMISDEQKAGLDLSSWEVAFVGAEPVRAETLERFAAAFASCGFRKEALYPCYGMAEATLIISGGRRLALPKTVRLDGDGILREAESESDVGRQVKVSCGYSWLDQRVLIVDSQLLTPCPDGEVGEIWASGPSVAQGYWNRPEETEQIFGARLAGSGEGPFLRTGDLGFLSGAELYVTGRRKDLIIIRGRNYYPQDIEQSVELSHQSLSPGGTAAFSVEVDGHERLVVVQELRRSVSQSVNTDEVCAAVRRAVQEQHQLSTYAVVLLKPFTISKTSSGKIQRHQCRAKYLAGALEVAGRWRLEDEPSTEVSVGGPSSFARQVSGRTGDELYESLLAFYRKEIIGLPGLAQDEVLVDRPLNTLGFDSLLMNVLINRVKEEVGLKLSLVDIMEGMTLAGLATAVQSHLEDSPTGCAARPASHQQKIGAPPGLDLFADGADPAEMLGDVDQFSDDEVRELMAQIREEKEPEVSQMGDK